MLCVFPSSSRLCLVYFRFCLGPPTLMCLLFCCGHVYGGSPSLVSSFFVPCSSCVSCSCWLAPLIPEGGGEGARKGQTFVPTAFQKRSPSYLTTSILDRGLVEIIDVAIIGAHVALVDLSLGTFLQQGTNGGYTETGGNSKFGHKSNQHRAQFGPSSGDFDTKWLQTDTRIMLYPW